MRRRRQLSQVVGAPTASNELYSQEIIIESMGPDTTTLTRAGRDVVRRFSHTHSQTHAHRRQLAHRHRDCEKFSLVEGVEIGN